jgi:cysteinyl-tRNA synthetase
VLPRSDGKTDMVTLIKQLIASGHAYEAGGEVLFDTQSMPDYGALSGRKLDEQRPGARVAVDAHKKSPLDFVLWKQSSGDEPGWESPWGRGRPGWHIECSAMSEAYLGEVFDIHGGGLDLIFPHHENELAQSRCAHGTSVMANYWMHNGFVEVEGNKMSKSEGNFVTIRDLLTDWPGTVLRLNMLKTHYRSPFDWTAAGVRTSALELDGWKTFTEAPDLQVGEVPAAVINALCDDLNTSLALTEIRKLVDACRASSDPWSKPHMDLLASSLFLGIDPRRFDFQKILSTQRGGIDEPKVATLIDERTAARARKDFKESDRIRDELAAMGVTLKDGKDSTGKPTTTWEIAR